MSAWPVARGNKKRPSESTEQAPVYAGYKGQNDLSDDINVRSRTINYLSGGSVFNPKEPGLGVPLEMSICLLYTSRCV